MSQRHNLKNFNNASVEKDMDKKQPVCQILGGFTKKYNQNKKFL